MLLKTSKLADSYRVRWELFSDLVDFDMEWYLRGGKVSSEMLTVKLADTDTADVKQV